MALSTALVLALSATPSAWEEPPKTAVDWHAGPYYTAMGRARAERRPLFLYFWTAGSDHCNRLDQDTIGSPAGASELADFVCFRADVGDPKGANLVQRYNVSTLPTMLVLAPDGSLEDAIIGYIGPQPFASQLQRIKSGTNTVSALRGLAEAAPEDLQLRFNLAVKLNDVGQADESKALMESIQADDPEGRTVVGAQLALWDVMNDIVAQAGDASDPATFALEPMYEHLRRVGPPAVLFEGWDWVARIESVRGNREAACKAYETAWPHVPERTENDWGTQVFASYWEMRDDLSRSSKRFALAVAERVYARAVAMPDLDPETNFVLTGKDYDGYLAQSLDVLARAQFMNGQRAKAVGTVEQAIELAPEESDYQARLAFFQGRKK